MAEVKDENERAVYEKSTLERIIEIINKKKANLPYSIIIREGKSIGILSFIKEKERVIRKCYAISMVVDKTEVEYIYDEKGDRISIVWELGDNIFVSNDPDIILDREILINSIKLSQDTINDNQGRHIANIQERIMSSDESALKNNTEKTDEISNESRPNADTNTPINWADMGITLVDYAATINLRTIYNGRYMKDMFNFPHFLKDKLPAGTYISNLNHIGIVKSESLTEKDGKKRENEYTFVVVDNINNPKDMIELDYLKQQAQLSKQEDIAADKSSKRYGDGETKEGASTTTNGRHVFTVEIPNAGNQIGQPDDFITLELRMNPKYVDQSTSQVNDANNLEIYLGIQDKASSQYYQKTRRNKILYKLEADNENYNKIEQYYQKRDFENYKGPDDEFEYTVYNESGESRDANERDERDVNSQMKQEEQEHKKNVNKQYENDGQATAEVANQVNDERQHYTEMAMEIAYNNAEYGNKDVRYIYNQIMNKKAEMEKANMQITDEELKNRVQQDLKNERFLGDSGHGRRPA